MNTQKLNWNQIDNDSLKWLGIDFDQTLAHSSGYPDFIPSEPIEGAVEATQKLAREGWKIIIHTSRHWADYQNIENWLNFYQIPFRRIVCGKLMAKYYIDDRAIHFDNWENVLNEIDEKERQEKKD